MDYNLAMAVKTLKEEKCPSCGVPIWHAFSEDSAIAFKEDEQICYGCQHQEEQRKGRTDKPGERYIARAVPEVGYDTLPTRADFYERMHKKAIRTAEREAEERQKLEAA